MLWHDFGTFLKFCSSIPTWTLQHKSTNSIINLAIVGEFSNESAWKISKLPNFKKKIQTKDPYNLKPLLQH
jgi:hypothetical protein